MVKRLWFVVASLGLVLSAAVLLWRVDGAEAQQTRRSYFPLITRSARVASSVTTLQVGVAGALQPNGNVLYTVRITNTAAVGVSVLPLDFSYNSNYLQFLSAQYTPDITGAGVLRWNDLTQFPAVGDLGPAGSPTATRTFTILMDPILCPEGGMLAVQVYISGAISATNELLPPTGSSASQRLCTAVQISKSLVDLPSGQALVGDLVTYQIVITNPVENASAPPALRTLRNLQVTDRFNPDILAFRSALLGTGNGFTPISPTTPITTTPTGSVDFLTPLQNVTLEPGQSLTLRITFEVRACSSEAGTVNIAEVGSPRAQGTLVTQARARAPLLRIICPNIQVTKRVQTTQQGPIAFGEQVTFTIAVKATGNQAINVVPMQDTFDPSVLRFVDADPQPSGRDIGGQLVWDDLNRARGRSLQPGEVYTVTARFEVIGCPTGGSTANRATIGNAIASGGGYGFTAPQSSDTVEFDVACPKLEVEKRLLFPRSGLVLDERQTAVFQVTVRNTGNLPLATIPMTDTFNLRADASGGVTPPLYEFVSASVQPTSQTGSTLRWTNLAAASPLQPGDSIAVLITLRTLTCPTTNAPITTLNSVGVSGAQANFRTSTLPVPADFATAEVDYVCARLSISKTLVAPTTGAVSPLDPTRNELTFRIQITNTGNITVTKLPLVDDYDPGILQYVRADTSFTPDIPGQGSLTWSDLTKPSPNGIGQPLRPGQRISFTVTFRAIGCPNNSIVPGNQLISNKVTITGARGYEPRSGQEADIPNVYASADARIACPQLEIEKRLLVAPDCDIVGVNQNIDYEIIIRNRGNTTIATLPLTDTFESYYLEFVSATPQPDGPPTLRGSGQSQTGTLNWSDLTQPEPRGFARDLPPGESLTVRVRFRTLRSTYDIVRSPARYTINRAGITGAVDEYGFRPQPVESGPVPVRIAQADLRIQMFQSSPYPEVRVNPSNQITDTLRIGGPNTDQLSTRVVVPGELITYTVQFRNEGPDEANAIRITDIIPQGTRYVRHTLLRCEGRDIREGCFLGTLGAGQSETFQVVVQVPKVSDPDFTTPPGTTLVNTIRIESGFTPTGPTCGIPDYLNQDNVSRWSTDVLGDFGDAPASTVAGLVDPGYGTGVTGTYNGNYIHEWLGRWVSGERSATDTQDPDGAPNLNPFNYDFYDDGVFFRNPWNTSVPTTQRIYIPAERAVTARVIVSAREPNSNRYGLENSKRIFVKAWADVNHNGVFDDPNDQVMFTWNGAPGQQGSDGSSWDRSQPYQILDLPIRVPSTPGYMVVRVRLSYGSEPTPTGALDYGETEDYIIGVFIGSDFPAPPGPPQPPRR